jgi:hypothetical protein
MKETVFIFQELFGAITFERYQVITYGLISNNHINYEPFAGSYRSGS